MARRSTALAIVAAGAALALGLTGCASGSSGGKITLNYWINTQQGPAGDGLKSMVADFEKANPNITVDVTQKSTDALKTALRQAAGTPAMPDVYFQWSGLGLGGTYVKQGVDLDLTKYYKQYDWTSRFTKSSLASVTQYGGYHGVPYTADVEAIVYNKALFTKAGITTPPSTYDELFADAKMLKDAGITPIEFGGTVNWYLMRLLDNLLETKCGSATFDKLTALKGNWGTEKCVTDAFTDLKTWANDYLNPGWASETDAQGQAVFYQKQAAMALEGDWFGGSLKQANFTPASDLGVFAFPTGTGRIYGLQQANYISKTSKNPQAAAKFLDFWMSKATQAKYAGSFSQIPVVNGVEAGDNGVGITSTFIDLAKNATGQFQNNDQTLPLDVTTEFWRIQNGVATGSIAPSDAGKQMQTFIKNRPGN